MTCRLRRFGAWVVVAAALFPVENLDAQTRTDRRIPVQQITGVVTDVERGAPLEDATVRVQGTDLSVTTNSQGEFILRDIQDLRQGEYDFVDHLVEQLRRVEAKVGEYPEGLVIEGGRPLKGERIDGRGHPGLVQAFAVAGLVAHGEMEIAGADCVEASFPGFFDLLDGLQAPRARENA